jgi:heme-degrading monooxygenase HmoA
MISNTPQPPYYAVIFTSEKTEIDIEGYAKMASQMETLAVKQDGFLGLESARNNVGITVSYWKDLDSIKKWKQNTDHLFAQEKGKKDWYKVYTTRIAKVEHQYSFEKL